MRMALPDRSGGRGCTGRSLQPHSVLRTCYAVPCTEIGYAVVLRTCCAMSGTEAAGSGTRLRRTGLSSTTPRSKKTGARTIFTSRNTALLHQFVLKSSQNWAKIDPNCRGNCVPRAKCAQIAAVWV
eukprot:1821455-Rhodomonas_salina.3